MRTDNLRRIKQDPRHKHRVFSYPDSTFTQQAMGRFQAELLNANAEAFDFETNFPHGPVIYYYICDSLD